MTSTEYKTGITSSNRPSSRILKPPGGGHSNIFAEPEVSVNAPRPKYNQQNSSNLNECIGSTDPNYVVEKLREEIAHTKQTGVEKGEQTNAVTDIKQPQTKEENCSASGNARSRIPPGGYSSGGFW